MPVRAARPGAERAGGGRRLKLYFVAAAAAVAEARALARHSQLSAGHVVSDTHDAMGSVYEPVGLTAVLVDRDGAVRSIRQSLGPASQLEGSLKALNRASPEGLDDPDGDVVLAGQAWRTHP